MTKPLRIQYDQNFRTDVKGTYIVQEIQEKKKIYKWRQIRKWHNNICVKITLNVNRRNAPTKRHRLAEWIQKQDPYMCCLQETHFRSNDT